jgi:hypothetical protein
MTLAGFPHSGISGSTPTCGSPKLFAACRALLRLSMPRHPPCALVRLTGYARCASEEARITSVHLFLRTRVGARVLLSDSQPNPSNPGFQWATPTSRSANS